MSQCLIINGVILSDVLKSELQYEADQLDNEIKGYREKIMMFAAASPRDLKDIEDNQIDWIDHCQFEINSILQDLERALVKRHLVEVALHSDDQDLKESF